jgi:hypothetical protein
MEFVKSRRGALGGLDPRFQQSFPIAGLPNMLPARTFLDQTPQSLDNIA